MRFSDVAFLILVLAGTASGQSLADLTEHATALFGENATLHAVPDPVKAGEDAALSKENGEKHAWRKITVWRVEKDDAFVGAIMVDNVKGKARPITYFVAFEATGAIRALEVLTYRESHGGEVRSPLFREQFNGKRHSDAIAVGRDIRNVSGATISSRALTRGARALSTLMHFLLQEKRL